MGNSSNHVPSIKIRMAITSVATGPERLPMIPFDLPPGHYVRRGCGTDAATFAGDGPASIRFQIAARVTEAPQTSGYLSRQLKGRILVASTARPRPRRAVGSLP